MVAQGLQLAVKNDLTEIAGVTEAIHAFSAQSGIPNEVDYALQLIADELLSNIIRYGCPAGGPHTITINLQAKVDEVWVLLHISSSLICHPGPTVGYRIVTPRATLAYLTDHEPALGVQRFPLHGEWTSGYTLAAGA